MEVAWADTATVCSREIRLSFSASKVRRRVMIFVTDAGSNRVWASNSYRIFPVVFSISIAEGAEISGVEAEAEGRRRTIIRRTGSKRFTKIPLSIGVSDVTDMLQRERLCLVGTFDRVRIECYGEIFGFKAEGSLPANMADAVPKGIE